MAITLTATDLEAVLGTNGGGRAAKLLAIASELVNQEGGEDAPDAISNEAVILVAAFVKGRHFGPNSEKKIGDLTVRVRAVGSAMRLSGARTMLSAWRERDIPVEPDGLETMRWLPWGRETRASSTADYSTVVQDAILALAEGKAAASPYSTAAVESCAGLWARSFAQAIVTPRGSLEAATLYDVGRDLALSGEFVALLEVGSSGPVFTRPSSHTCTRRSQSRELAI